MAYNDDEPENVRKSVIENIIKDKELYRNVGQEHLRCLKIDIHTWIKLMTSDSVFGDKLMIFALSRTYHRQTVVFTSRGFWTTLGSDDPISVNRILEICDIKLLYVGLHMYGELRRKPFVTVTAQALLEALDSILPPTTDSDSDPTSKVVDLTVKHQDSTNVHYNSGSSDGSKSSAPYIKAETSNSDHIGTPTRTSDTPSESLLSANSAVNSACNNSKNPDTETDQPTTTGNPE